MPIEMRNRVFPKSINRRRFLALGFVGTAAATADWPKNSGRGEPLPAKPAREAQSLDTGGIAPEYFEKARERAAAVVTKLTLAEKISQLGSSVPAVPRVGLPPFKFSGEALHGRVQTGPVTSFPLPLALGCSWNRSLMHRVFTAVSDEIWAWHKKTGESQVMFSPATVNMGTRDPRYGRIAENYGEDPYLVGQMAIYTVHAMQGHDPRYLKSLACAKHFVAAEDTQASSVAFARDRSRCSSPATRSTAPQCTASWIFASGSRRSTTWGCPQWSAHAIGVP